MISFRFDYFFYFSQPFQKLNPFEIVSTTSSDDNHSYNTPCLVYPFQWWVQCYRVADNGWIVGRVVSLFGFYDISINADGTYMHIPYIHISDGLGEVGEIERVEVWKSVLCMLLNNLKKSLQFGSMLYNR